MKKKLVVLVAFLLGLNLGASAQSGDGFGQVDQDRASCFEIMLLEDQFKIKATDMDLATLQIDKSRTTNGKFPLILMPTSHANEYALIDFSPCPDGVYTLKGMKGESEICYTFKLKNQK